VELSTSNAPLLTRALETSGGDRVDYYERLRRIDKLFEHRWDVFVVASLADGPRRFGQLTYDVSLHTRRKVSDASVTKIKNRLLRTGILHKTVDDDGHPVYELTATGRTTADVVASLTRAFDDCHRSDNDQPGSSQAA